MKYYNIFMFRRYHWSVLLWGAGPAHIIIWEREVTLAEPWTKQTFIVLSFLHS